MIFCFYQEVEVLYVVKIIVWKTVYRKIKCLKQKEEVGSFWVGSINLKEETSILQLLRNRDQIRKR